MMNNVFFLEATTKGRYSSGFVGEPPLEQMGFKAGDEKLLLAPLDWIGFHFYGRRVVSDASKEIFASGGAFSGTEIESNSPGGPGSVYALPCWHAHGRPAYRCRYRDLAARHLRPCYPNHEGIYHPIIEITESGCGYLDSPNEQGRIPDTRPIDWYRQVLAELARAIADGANVRAYHAWSLIDNLQWGEGFTERYGLIYNDFRSQKRTIKDSGL